MSLGIVTEVGKVYNVPCMYTKCRGSFIPNDGWVPVLGPKHEDAEHLNFPDPHYHVDWRFIPAQQYRQTLSGRPSGSTLGTVLTNTEGYYPGTVETELLRGTPVLKRRLCKRAMPIFPARPNIDWARLERAQAFVCNKLKPGNICPHRGIDLTPFIEPDGTAICPGHGLRWDTKTGDMLPRHATGACA